MLLWSSGKLKQLCPLDLLALAQLKHAMKPKLRLLQASEDSAANLFDQLIECSSDTEQLADACGTPVLLPARCRFVISDVTRLGPLLAGMPCFAVKFSVTFHPMMYLSRIIQVLSCALENRCSRGRVRLHRDGPALGERERKAGLQIS